MTDIDISQHAKLGGFSSNAFGDRYLFTINRNVFENSDAGSVFSTYFGESLFEEDTFYVIAGTDSGLLYQYIKKHGAPKGSHYLFVELPQVLALLENADTTQAAISVATGENWLEQLKAMEGQKYALLDRLILTRSLGVIHNHYSGYPPFWRKLKEDFDAYLWDQRTILSLRQFIIRQIENLTENQIPAICLKNSFQGKTAVVLSGGPSLDELLPWVKQHRRNLLVIAVSRISRSLLDAGIQPDISVSIDPQSLNLKASRDVLQFQEGTLLLNDFHLSSNLLSSWGGAKAYLGPRYPWATPLEPDNLPSTEGTTVTNAALGIAIECGVAQIVMGGADFCFSQDGYTHASGTAEHARGPRPTVDGLQVETNGGMIADTLNVYVQSAASIDTQAEKACARGCRTINPATGAMRLPNVEHVPLDALEIDTLEQSAADTLAERVPRLDAKTITALYAEELKEVDRILAELRSVKELSGKALVYNRKLFAKKEKGAGFHNKEKVERIEEQLNKKHADLCAFIRNFGVTRFIPILRLDEDQYVEDLEVSCRLYHQATVDTCDELLDILQQARSRIMARIEEEKPKPNVTRLLEQWRRDQQPGRALQWEERHAQYAAQLPDPLKQSLHQFQGTFDDIVEASGQQYISGIKREAELAGVAGKAREYFECQDPDGLKRLLSVLAKHQDQKQAVAYIPLLQGYLAELSGKPDTAITEYQKITNGPSHIDALFRLFAMYTNARNFEAALAILKTLSSLSATYSPMYADMLYASGDIDNAVEVYTDYLLSNPDDLETMMKLGKVFAEGGSSDGVAWTMGYILEKDPGNQAARDFLNELGVTV